MDLVAVWTLLVLPVIVAAAVLWIAAVVSVARSKQASEGLNMVLWLMLVTFAPLLGPVLWFAVGRRQALPA